MREAAGLGRGVKNLQLVPVHAHGRFGRFHVAAVTLTRDLLFHLHLLCEIACDHLGVGFIFLQNSYRSLKSMNHLPILSKVAG